MLFAWPMSQEEVKAGQVSCPTSLTTREILWVFPVFEILMIRNDLEFFRQAFKVMPPLDKSTDDRQHLSVVNLVVPLCFTH